MLAVKSQPRVLRPPLTALIDVVFILLLFFMLSSTFEHTRQIEVKTTAAGATASHAESVLLTVQEDGRVATANADYSLDSVEFIARLQAWKLAADTLVVAAEQEASMQRLVAVLDVLSGAGISRFSLAESRAP